MKLTLEQIKTIAVGALKVGEVDGAFRFDKCTQKQVDAWYKLDEILGFYYSGVGVHMGCTFLCA